MPIFLTLDASIHGSIIGLCPSNTKADSKVASLEDNGSCHSLLVNSKFILERISEWTAKAARPWDQLLTVLVKYEGSIGKQNGIEEP